MTPAITPKITSSKAIHVFYLVLLCALALCGWSWLREHDARMQIAADLKVSQKTEATLQDQIKALHTTTAQQVTAIQRKVSAIKTTPQAIAAIPSLASLPLHERAIPEMPSAVAVDAVALAQELGQCKEASIQLAACQQELTLKDGIHDEDVKQIALLKKKPSWIRRLGGALKNDAIFIVVGVALKVAIR